MVDFHSHILPNVDHGAASLDISIQMLNAAKKAGVTKIVATPHFYSHKDSLHSFLERRSTAITELRNYIAENSSIGIDIICGAEVALGHKLLSHDLKQLTIEGTNAILIEMPMFDHWQSWMFDMLYEIESRFSLTVILAHVDRYGKEKAERLLDMGFLAQINAESLVRGSFGEKRRMRSFCKNGAIHLIGSDAHDISERTYTDLILASKKLPRALLSYFEENALDILAN
ncbi:MAG: hypothetical protein IJW46_05190 [Clostridia bacterium]|nr:hypothetical protein [Clostridia bacterium]